MLSCKDANRLTSESLDRRLSLRARLGLRVHLLMCSGCRTASRQMMALDGLIRGGFAGDRDSRPPSTPTEPEARERVRRVMHSTLDRED